MREGLIRMLKEDEELVKAMLERARIRRSIPRSEPDRIADQLEQAAKRIEELTRERDEFEAEILLRRYE